MQLILCRHIFQTFFTENRLNYQIQLLQSNPVNSLKKKVTAAYLVSSYLTFKNYKHYLKY